LVIGVHFSGCAKAFDIMPNMQCWEFRASHFIHCRSLLSAADWFKGKSKWLLLKKPTDGKQLTYVYGKDSDGTEDSTRQLER